MAANRDTPCRKFQANMFNKSKCQNCFKPRDTHLLNDEDLTQAKPIYGGWLLLAPEGTNFENPLHRSRKWQRRFFLLYEHGLLRYALDDMSVSGEPWRKSCRVFQAEEELGNVCGEHGEGCRGWFMRTEEEELVDDKSAASWGLCGRFVRALGEQSRPENDI